ncbi:MAG: DUF1015 family protein [Bacteroidota bacterium]
MRINPFQAVLPELELITSADSFFDTVKEEYPDYFKSGFFNKNAQEALYVYQIRTLGRAYTGLIACTAIQDYLEGHIRKHEQTLAAKEQKQVQLLLGRRATVKPILLTYPAQASINAWTAQYIEGKAPFMRFLFDNDQQEHLLWEVAEGADIQHLQQLFAKAVPHTYIADGHHRTSTTALMFERKQEKVNEAAFDQLLCALFPSTDIEIHDFNRIVDGLNELPVSVFMAKLSRLFDIKLLKNGRKPSKKFHIHMYLQKNWFRLKWRSEVLKRYQKKAVVLDTQLLDELVLKKIIGIKNVRNDSRIQYVEGPKGTVGIERKVNKSNTQVGFCLPPVSLEELIELADEGKALPPKSTWFEPRMKNGLVVKDY